MASELSELDPTEVFYGGELPHVKGEFLEIKEAWVSWELLRRAVLFNTIDGMKLEDIADSCGFESGDAIYRREVRAIESAKVDSDV